MEKSDLVKSLNRELKAKLHLLEDKPEETLESTLRALWLFASDSPVSAEGSLKLPLPDLSKQQIAKLNQLIDLRLRKIPLAHITGRQSFMGIELLSDTRALIPRKETEILGQNALAISKDISSSKGKITVIDACCGSGNLGIAVAYYNSDCMVYATDISQEAVELTRDNINFLNLNERVTVRQGDLLSAYESDEFIGKTDLIMCNPPYILSSKVGKMDSEIASYEPALAFDGGMLGIKVIQKLIAEAPRFLTKKGWLIFEVGAGQGDFIAKMAERAAQYKQITLISDRSGVARVIKLRK